MFKKGDLVILYNYQTGQTLDCNPCLVTAAGKKRITVQLVAEGVNRGTATKGIFHADTGHAVMQESAEAIRLYSMQDSAEAIRLYLLPAKTA